ncbi:MAG: hypothetical protein WBN51_11750 [Gammaproteobacteria bacterium]
MNIPTGKPAEISAAIDTLMAACGTLPARPAAGAPTDLPPLMQALEQLLDVMARVEVDARAAADNGRAREIGREDVTEIGVYAFGLHASLVSACEQARAAQQRESLAGLAVDIALWIADHGGQLTTLEPVVDGLALLANAAMEPERLADLSKVISRVTAAVAPVIRQDLEKTNPGRPWRVLLLNHGIVATRSHDTALMEPAFALLEKQLPEDAARFFSEGMQQMDALDYPAHVRKVMEKYHRQWTVNRALH